MKTTNDDATQKMTTLSECLNKAVRDGYVESFRVNGEELIAEHGKKRFKPQDVGIPNFYRFEGYSDPEDNSVLYLVETIDGTLGTLVDSYGSDADANIATFIRKVEDIKKT
ncbi:MAG TPA: hypothetical protein VFW11_14580 [Cyclobacteriaceae bacterium]|nr:hypothetical protein [Cyclobacteriaceae bacterium]